MRAANWDWHYAKGQADQREFAGFHGSLATITTQAEQDFVNSIVPTVANFRVMLRMAAVRHSMHGLQAWIGGNDQANEGAWKWASGEENGLGIPLSGTGGPTLWG